MELDIVEEESPPTSDPDDGSGESKGQPGGVPNGPSPVTRQQRGAAVNKAAPIVRPFYAPFYFNLLSEI